MSLSDVLLSKVGHEVGSAVAEGADANASSTGQSLLHRLVSNCR